MAVNLQWQGSRSNNAPGGAACDYTGINLPVGKIIIASVVGNTNGLGVGNLWVNDVLATRLVFTDVAVVGADMAVSAFYVFDNPTANANSKITQGWNNSVGGIPQRCAIQWWWATGIKNVAFDTAIAPNSNPLNCTIDVPANGCAVALAHDPFGTVASAITWTNATEDSEAVYEGRRFGGAHVIGGASLQSNLVISANITNVATQPQAIAVSFESDTPPPPTVTNVSPNTGTTAGGTDVIITGTNFTGATLVSFGGAPAPSFTIVNDSRIDCPTPAYGAPGTYNVLVQTPFGSGVGDSIWTYTAPPVVTGTLTATEGGDAAAMAGKIASVGTLATTDASDLAAFAEYYGNPPDYFGGRAFGSRYFGVRYYAGTLPTAEIVGTLATTDDEDLAAFTAGIFGTGILAATEAEDVAAFTGKQAAQGTLAASEAADVAAFVGQAVAQGALVASEGIDAAIFAGVVRSAGVLAATEAADVAAFVGGGLVVTGTLAATEAADAAVFAGKLESRGALAATEAADVAIFVAKVVGTGILAATEAADIAVLTGGVVIGGPLAATEAPDLASFVGAGIGINGVLAATEAADVAVFAAKVASTGTLAASEAPDAAAFTGTAAWPIRTGTLAAVEAPDAAAFTGATSWAARTGILAATEAPDVALFTAKATITGALDATDAPDTALAVGGVAWRAVLAATEQPDAAAFAGTVTLAGVLAATEAPDAAAFAGGIVNVGTLDATEEPDTAFFFQTSIFGFFAAMERADNAIIVGSVGDYGVDIVGDQDPIFIHGGCVPNPMIVGRASHTDIKGTV